MRENPIDPPLFVLHVFAPPTISSRWPPLHPTDLHNRLSLQSVRDYLFTPEIHRPKNMENQNNMDFIPNQDRVSKDAGTRQVRLVQSDIRFILSIFYYVFPDSSGSRK